MPARRRALQPAIQFFRNRKSSLIEHGAEDSHVRGLQLLFGSANCFAPAAIGFDDQHDSVRQLPRESGIGLAAERRCADENVIKSLSQFGEALAIPFLRSAN